MSFTSLNFLFFVAACVVLYFIVPLKYRWLVLLAGSFSFYLLSSPKTFIFMIVTIVTTFYGGKAISAREDNLKAKLEELKEQDATKEEKTAVRLQFKKSKQHVVALMLFINFGILAFMKYFCVYLENFFGDALPDSLNFNAGLIIPLGISFYTFTSISYIIDLYRGKYRADTNIAKYALYVSFFPQIIQGPIARHDQLAEQLITGHQFSYERITMGIQLILWGCFKKLVIADRVGILVSQVFDNYTDYRGITVLVAAICYSIQIYGDFSGGIDIARGVAEIFGINMAENFNQPYFAKSMAEFWRRWHIALSSWSRDYIFYSLSLSKPLGKAGKSLRDVIGPRLGKQFSVIVATFITFTFIGVWHGAEFKYLAYGFYNAILISGAMVIEPALLGLNKGLRINTDTFSWRLFQMLRTFMLVSLGRLFPRAASYTVAIKMFKSMFVFNPGTFLYDDLSSFGYTSREFAVVIIGLAVWMLVSVLREKGVDVRKSLAEQNLWFRWLVYLALVFSVVICGTYGADVATSFIYRGF